MILNISQSYLTKGKQRSLSFLKRLIEFVVDSQLCLAEEHGLHVGVPNVVLVGDYRDFFALEPIGFHQAFSLENKSRESCELKSRLVGHHSP